MLRRQRRLQWPGRWRGEADGNERTAEEWARARVRERGVRDGRSDERGTSPWTRLEAWLYTEDGTLEGEPSQTMVEVEWVSWPRDRVVIPWTIRSCRNVRVCTDTHTTTAMHLQMFLGPTLTSSLGSPNPSPRRRNERVVNVPRTDGGSVQDRRATCGRGEGTFLINVIGDHCWAG